MTIAHRCFFAGLVVLLAGASGFAQDAPSPNVLILYSDDHSYFALGSESGGLVKTPNLDRLAREGVRFTRFAANHPVCTPSRATLQTGLYAPIHGAFQNNLFLDPAHTTYLAEVFARAGYATGFIGKWHMDGGSDAQGNPSLQFRPRELSFVREGARRRGYQEYLGYECCPISNQPFYWEESIQGPVFTPVLEYGWEPAFQREVFREFSARHGADGRPWMYEIALAAPHVPLQAAQEFLDLYDAETLPLPPWLSPNLTPEQTAFARGILRQYYAMVSHMDHEIGGILDDLDASGQSENTLIVFAGDNGNFLGAHWDDWFQLRPGMFQGKGEPSTYAFRVPMIMRWPARIPSRREVRALAGTVDLAPTILGLAGLPIPWRMQGLDMGAWALGGRGPERPAVWISLVKIFQPSFAAVWDGDYILSTWDTRLLFDLRSDPYERVNRLDDPAQAWTRQRLGEHLYAMTAEAYNPPELPRIESDADAAVLRAEDLAPQAGAALVVDGMPIRAHLALARAVGAGRGGSEALRRGLLSAFAQNLEAFDQYDFQRGRRFRALATVSASSSSELAEFVEARLDDRFGLELRGPTRAVFCDAGGACYPEGPFTPPPLRGVRDFVEPLAGSGDVDGDGLSNAEEYANSAAVGGNVEHFARAALDPELDGTEAPDNGGGCFIATAAYGTPMAAELDGLRRLRDRRLLVHAPGAAFVDAYYRMSPPVARWIGTRATARAGVRAVLGATLAVCDSFGAMVLGLAVLGVLWASSARTRSGAAGGRDSSLRSD